MTRKLLCLPCPGENFWRENVLSFVKRTGQGERVSVGGIKQIGLIYSLRTLLGKARARDLDASLLIFRRCRVACCVSLFFCFSVYFVGSEGPERMTLTLCCLFSVVVVLFVALV